jgi:hypothetical protein
VRDVLAGSEAVISALGPSLKRSARHAAHRGDPRHHRGHGRRRRASLHRSATPSVPDPRDGPTIKAKLLPLIARVSFPNAFIELPGMTAAVTGSELDWTLARITNPTDRPAKGTLRVGFLGRDRVGWTMTRADIAAFLVGQLSDKTYLRAAPAISN